MIHAFTSSIPQLGKILQYNTCIIQIYFKVLRSTDLVGEAQSTMEMYWTQIGRLLGNLANSGNERDGSNTSVVGLL